MTTETVQLAVLDDGEALYIGKVDGEHTLRLNSTVGQRLTAHATGVGKVLLSEQSEREIGRWLRGRKLERFTPNTITDPRAFLVELGRVRKNGYAIDREERTLGAACVAVAVRNQAGECIAAMSVSAPAVRFGSKQRKMALTYLRRAAVALTNKIGSPQRRAERRIDNMGDERRDVGKDVYKTRRCMAKPHRVDATLSSRRNFSIERHGNELPKRPPGKAKPRVTN